MPAFSYSFKVFETVFIEQIRIATDAVAFDPESAQAKTRPAHFRKPARDIFDISALALKKVYLLGGRGASVESRVGHECFLSCRMSLCPIYYGVMDRLARMP
jgi:hypothetical protein